MTVIYPSSPLASVFCGVGLGSSKKFSPTGATSFLSLAIRAFWPCWSSRPYGNLANMCALCKQQRALSVSCWLVLVCLVCSAWKSPGRASSGRARNISKQGSWRINHRSRAQFHRALSIVFTNGNYYKHPISNYCLKSTSLTSSVQRLCLGLQSRDRDAALGPSMAGRSPE